MDHLTDQFRLLIASPVRGEEKHLRIVEVGAHATWGAALEAARTRGRTDGYAVIVAPHVIVHRDLAVELAWAVGDPGLTGVTWSGLLSDGFDITGRWCDAGNYPEDPAVPGHLPLRLAGTASSAVTIITPDTIDHLADGIMTLDALIRWGLTSRRPAFLSGRVRFSAERQRHDTIAPAAPPVLRDLTNLRADPSLTVVVRSAERELLLRRNLLSLLDEVTDGVDVIVTTMGRSSSIGPIVDDVLPGHRVSVLEVPVTDQPHRTEAIHAAIAAARGEYVWFVDDDDWVAEGAISRIRSAVHASDRPIIVGAVDSHREVWGDGTLAASSAIRRYLPGEWYRAFGGWNHLPNCGVVLPTELARQRLAQVPLHSDLGEDFALQLLLYTAQGAAVTVLEDTIAHVSVRMGDDNTVTMEDRVPWLRDIGSHVSTLARDPSASTAAFWRLGRAIREIPYPAPTGDEAAGGEDGSTSGAGVFPSSERGRLRRRLRRR